jgi:hypothetical protein
VLDFEKMSYEAALQLMSTDLAAISDVLRVKSAAGPYDNAALGGLLGGGLGGLYGYMSGDNERSRRERMLGYGLGGSLLGAGAGYGLNELSKPQPASPVTAPPAALTGAEVLKNHGITADSTSQQIAAAQEAIAATGGGTGAQQRWYGWQAPAVGTAGPVLGAAGGAVLANKIPHWNQAYAENVVRNSLPMPDVPKNFTGSPPSLPQPPVGNVLSRTLGMTSFDPAVRQFVDVNSPNLKGNASFMSRVPSRGRTAIGGLLGGMTGMAGSLGAGYFSEGDSGTYNPLSLLFGGSDTYQKHQALGQAAAALEAHPNVGAQ